MIVKKYDDGYVDYSCDSCGKIVHIQYASLVSRKRLDKQYCRVCAVKINNIVERRKQTCIQKYGNENHLKNKDIAKKHKKACIELTKKQRTDFDSIKKAFKDEGYTLLTKKYINNAQKLEFICPNGHRHSISWNKWNSAGQRCKQCYHDKRGKDQTLDVEHVKKELRKENYELLSDYNGAHKHITYKCPEGHTGTITFNNWKTNGTRCSTCANKESKPEIEVREFLSKYFSNILFNDRKLIKPYELDIVISDKKIAIEYCGLYWHSDVGGKDKNYHLRKLELCKVKGYELITIFEDEWLFKNDIVKSRLLYKLGVSDSKRVFARKCEIKEISPTEKGKFLENNHIQGSDKSSVQIGAFFDNRLISVMTFGKPNISRISKYAWELNRFCTDKDILCIGVASRLFKYFVTKYNPSTIITYGDKRWSTGNLYKKLGFKYLRDSNPNYWYSISGLQKRLHRYKFRKSVLKDKIEKFDSNLSERENMKNNGYYRIYDCGNVVWLYKRTDN